MYASPSVLRHSLTLFSRLWSTVGTSPVLSLKAMNPGDAGTHVSLSDARLVIYERLGEDLRPAGHP